MSAGSNHRKVGDTVCGPNGDRGRHVWMGLDHILSILMPNPVSRVSRDYMTLRRLSWENKTKEGPDLH